MKFEHLQRPLSIQGVRDGGAYVLPSATLVQTNLFLEVACVDELYLKLPSARGFEDYRKFLKLAQTHPEDVRPLEDAERFDALEQALDQFPALRRFLPLDPEIAHYLAVHNLQYQRIRNQTAIGIPIAVFGVARSARPFGKIRPAFFQQRVPGTTLWEMFDFTTSQVKRRWVQHLPIISAQLSNLLDSGLLHHLDWNIRNFVFDETYERLFYVDLKPATFVARSSNEHNLQGIRDYFLV